MLKPCWQDRSRISYILRRALLLAPFFIVLFAAGGLVSAPPTSPGRSRDEPPRPARKTSTLTLVSPDGPLARSFDWAKEQALAYVFEGDPVGDWYEAALPGREAFCMRDVSHQATGAHALGLQAHTLNMLRKFAASISESKDWCTYWEINRFDRPAPVDYRNDKEFWYNLPANFDVLDCCWRVYLWSGDRAYLEDPVFLNFYQTTVEAYVERWDLDEDRVTRRERFMNRPAFDMKDPYQSCRGIPSYDEEEPGRTKLGIDLLAFQAAAYRSYARILERTGKPVRAAAFLKKSEATRRLLEKVFWESGKGRFATLLLTDGRLSNRRGMEVYALYTDILDSRDRIRKTLRSLVDDPAPNIELLSHYPEVFFKYGAHREAYKLTLELSDARTDRREYPEVSFALIGALVGGMMGIQPDGPTGGIATLSRLTEKTPWVEMSHLPARKNVVRVRHTGREETRLTNLSGPALTWLARFYGEGAGLLVEGKPAPASSSFDRAGLPVISARVTVEPGETLTVQRFAPPR